MVSKKWRKVRCRRCEVRILFANIDAVSSRRPSQTIQRGYDRSSMMRIQTKVAMRQRGECNAGDRDATGWQGMYCQRTRRELSLGESHSNKTNWKGYEKSNRTKSTSRSTSATGRNIAPSNRLPKVEIRFTGLQIHSLKAVEAPRDVTIFSNRTLTE
jgi:hypothetical protein